jgi:hypothetical protein
MFPLALLVSVVESPELVPTLACTCAPSAPLFSW